MRNVECLPLLPSNRKYRRDVLGNSARFSEIYAYDELHRLQVATRGELNNDNDGLIGFPSSQRIWEPDATGNWKTFARLLSAPLIQQRTHNTVNEITDISQTYGAAWHDPAYDNNGNMTTMPNPKDLEQALDATYDAWNRLVKTDDSTTVVEYAYDGLNRRITKTSSGSTRHYYYSDQWQVLEERLDSDTTADRQYVWGLRYIDDLVLRDTSSERLYALQDALFNVVALTDDTGAVVERFAYQAYGESEALDPDYTTYSGTDYGWTYRFTGRELDLETGLQINRMRYLHLQLGRWITRDPIGYEDNMSLYQYAADDPIHNADPMGLVVPVVPIVIGASCVACWGVFGTFFNTAHEICKNSESNTEYMLCFISAVDEMESILDWYSWTVANAACLACGGGLSGAAKKMAQKMAAKRTRKRATKKVVKEEIEEECEEFKECAKECARHQLACNLTKLADHPEIPGNKGSWPRNRCEACGLKCLGNCRLPKGKDKRWPWPSRGEGGAEHKWSRCDYWNWPTAK